MEDYQKGERVLLRDKNSQTFVGDIKSINPDLGRIVLTNIIQVPGDKPVIGYRNFDKNEISKIKKLQNGEVNGDFLNETAVFNHCETKEINKTAGPKLSESELNEIKELQSEYRYIRDFGTNFHTAISLLKSSSKIAVCAKDVSKGRSKRASVLAISTPSSIFVFDLQVLGDDVLEKGLKKILESSDIIKVIHDSRLLSDCLKHMHLICLNNVRDIEAEDIIVVFQERRMVRRHSRSLEYLTNLYLGVDIEGCDEVGDVWNERPLPPNLLEGLVKSVSYLLPLQEAIERNYMKWLVDASLVYCNHLRTLDFFSFLQNDPKKTLRKNIINVLERKNETRSSCRSKKAS